mmetsp:Transcript_11594/g.26554  ORF Transcript_11594/g.26554 Transcript_11594/m.26554 type:complete len:308 (+) Transcript_11594:1297-2220(+)
MFHDRQTFHLIEIDDVGCQPCKSCRNVVAIRASNHVQIAPQLLNSPLEPPVVAVCHQVDTIDDDDNLKLPASVLQPSSHQLLQALNLRRDREAVAHCNCELARKLAEKLGEVESVQACKVNEAQGHETLDDMAVQALEPPRHTVRIEDAARIHFAESLGNLVADAAAQVSLSTGGRAAHQDNSRRIIGVAGRREGEEDGEETLGQLRPLEVFGAGAGEQVGDGEVGDVLCIFHPLPHFIEDVPAHVPEDLALKVRRCIIASDQLWHMTVAGLPQYLHRAVGGNAVSFVEIVEEGLRSSGGVEDAGVG